MHIVFVTPQLATKNNSSGGLASFIANMARIFADNGHRISIILASTKAVSTEFGSNIEVYYFHISKNKWKNLDRISKWICKISKKNNDSLRRAFIALYKAKKVKKLIQYIDRKEKIDIVHYSDYGALSVFESIKKPYILRISGFTNICLGGGNTPNGSLEYKDNPLQLIDSMEVYTIKKSKYIVSPSYLLAGIVKENLGVSPVVIESPFVLEKKEWDEVVFNRFSLKEKKYIIHYGSLSYLKGIHIVSQISKEFLQQNKDYYLVLSGINSEIIEDSGNKITAEELVKKTAGEFANRVIYVGRLVREQLYPLIQGAKLCLLPSRIENLSNACIEAMAMGKIVVATNGASYEQLIDDRVSGFLCERDNPDSFLKAINEALNMTTVEQEIMGMKAIEVTKRLEPQKIYQQYLAFYEKVISEW